MNRLPLRVRLTLAFLALAALMAGVGVTSVVMHGRIRDRAAALRPEDVVDLRRVDLERSGLELQGRWDAGASTFVASDVELLPAIHDPRLRGVVDAVDVANGTLSLFGRTIRVDEDTRRVDGEPGGVDLAAIAPGRRVEVTCDLEDGVWTAEKIRLDDVKGNSKIKAMVRAVDLDGATVQLALGELRIAVEGPADATPDGALNHVRTATHMLMAALEFRASARELVDADGPNEAGVTRARARLERALDAFEDDLAHGASAGDGPWIEPIQRVAPELRDRVERLIAASRDDGADRADRDDVGALLLTDLLPFLERDLEPRILAYLSQSEGALGDDVEGIVAGAETTAFVALATSALAVLVALVLGFLVWRSIHRPIAALRSAAADLGRGKANTRVADLGRDELGELGDAFNRMAEQLATSTLSIENLENVLDSMAGALLLLDLSQNITGVNRAALELLGFPREDLIGRPLQHVCPTGLDGLIEGERLLIRRDGTTVPATFRAAKLGSNGSSRGYVCVAQDLTERKRIEARIRSSLAEKELLLREVHHRVKSNMQVISSLLAMQSMNADDPRLVAGFEESQGRIRSMALIHEQLYESADLARIDVRMYLDVLVDHLQRSHGRGDRIRVELDAHDLPLDLDESLACGLIVNELVVNAFKHAFPGDAGGVIRVALTGDGEGRATLEVVDDGHGLKAQAGGRETLGLSLVATLAAQLGGRHEVVEDGGLRVRIEFPCRASEAAA